jgi:hypothetical protein
MTVDPALRLCLLAAVALLALGVWLGNWPTFTVGVVACAAATWTAWRHHPAGPRIVHELVGTATVTVDVGHHPLFGWGVTRIEIHSASPLQPDYLAPYLASIAELVIDGPPPLQTILDAQENRP